jgi:hypothetical protein
MTHRRDTHQPGKSNDSPALRLERFLRSQACIVYHENLPDPEYPEVTCSIYGVPKTNELYVRITNGRVSFVAATASPLDYPAMADRIFGLDVLDHAVAFGLADRVWEQHRSELLSRPSS